MSGTLSRRVTRSSFKELQEVENDSQREETPVPNPNPEQAQEYTDDSGEERETRARIIETQSQTDATQESHLGPEHTQNASEARIASAVAGAKRPYTETEIPEVPGAKRMKYKKKIPANLMERFWDPLPDESKASLERLMLIALNRTLEKYTPGKKSEDVRIRETQKMLAENWLNKNVPKSFLARLDATNLPPLTSMKGFSRVANSADQLSTEFLGLDQLSRRKKYLETYLLAELKQLLELEIHYNSLEMSYQLDVKYLAEFKKTTAKNEQKMQQEIAKKRAAFNLDSYRKQPEGISLAEKSDDFLSSTSFNPNTDADTKEVNQILHKHLASLLANTQGLRALNDKIEVLYNYLDMM